MSDTPTITYINSGLSRIRLNKDHLIIEKGLDLPFLKKAQLVRYENIHNLTTAKHYVGKGLGIMKDKPDPGIAPKLVEVAQRETAELTRNDVNELRRLTRKNRWEYMLIKLGMWLLFFGSLTQITKVLDWYPLYVLFAGAGILVGIYYWYSYLALPFRYLFERISNIGIPKAHYSAGIALIAVITMAPGLLDIINEGYNDREPEKAATESKEDNSSKSNNYHYFYSAGTSEGEIESAVYEGVPAKQVKKMTITENVEHPGEYIVFTAFKAGESWSSDTLYFKLRERLTKSMQAMYGTGHTFTRIKFVAHGGTLDNYGNESEDVIYKVTLDKAVGEKVNWSQNWALLMDLLPDLWDDGGILKREVS